MKAKHFNKKNWKKTFWKIVSTTFRTITFTAFVTIVLTALALAYAYTVGGRTDALWMICGGSLGWFAVLGIIACVDKVQELKL